MLKKLSALILFVAFIGQFSFASENTDVSSLEIDRKALNEKLDNLHQLESYILQNDYPSISEITSNGDAELLAQLDMVNSTQFTAGDVASSEDDVLMWTLIIAGGAVVLGVVAYILCLYIFINSVE